MDYTNTLPQVAEGANAVLAINEAHAAASPAMVYARDAGGSSGLVWAWMGGRWGGTLVPGFFATLTASTTSYMVVDRADGAVSISTTNVDWLDITNYCRAYLITTGASSVTDYEDHRAGPNGTLWGGGSTGGTADLRDDVTALATSGTVDIDYSAGDYFTLALLGNVTSITFSNLPGAGKGASLMVLLTQDSTTRTVAWPASFKWEGAAPTISGGSGVKDLLAITTFDNGTTWHATLSKARA
jgi:hypothetical protein